ncbi:transcriptional regulator, HxlR family [Goodfellowiella coeruleoviolacea]|uniref:Transcriptional regulator, HxlR family n=2 Tax=Goodfellowiella coeruleoviolacea TaxID=334858 RepID=A0AAE3GC10_9PSEU|nr:transcriptional regulator, HxlR family [Goodfellowiella coeruleoviolacea]
MARERVQDMADHCAIEVAVSVLGGKWKLVIVEYLLEHPHRFGELHRRLPGITQRMLTRQLRELEADGIITRTVHHQVPPRVDYDLTDAGRRFAPAAEQLRLWGAWYKRQLVERDAAEPATSAEPVTPVS